MTLQESAERVTHGAPTEMENMCYYHIFPIHAEGLIREAATQSVRWPVQDPVYVVMRSTHFAIQAVESGYRVPNRDAS